MQGKVSVVINTLNSEKDIERAINSVKWANEILVCDMHSDDGTALMARKMGAKVIAHKKLNYVEPARNFAISKTEHEWVLVLDPDEEISETLSKKLQEMVDKPIVSTFVEIPRKNIIFGKWIKSSMWWPDYNIRFFKKDSVTWGNRIHRPPRTEGQGIKLPADERWAILHDNYGSISEFIGRMDRYTSVQAKELKIDGVEFDWKDLIGKPLSEFLSRYFANRGFEDGLHGFSLSLLQAFSFLLVYIKLWEMKEFKEKEIPLNELKELTYQSGKEIEFWFENSKGSKNPIKSILRKVRTRAVNDQ